MLINHNGWTDYTVGLLGLTILGLAAISYGAVLLIDWIDAQRRKRNERRR